MTALHHLESLPESFLTTAATDLHQLFAGPSLVHLPGRRKDILFVCLLQHGNEDSGLKAVQALLKKYHNKILPRPLSLFIANVRAARYGQRRLDGQPDYNRVWPGSEESHCKEAHIMAEIMTTMRERELFCAVDLHNNTGLNPHYGAVCRLDNRTLQLATLFNRIVVYFTTPKGMMVQSFAELCPSVVLECGQVGSPTGTTHALEFLDACLHMDHLPAHKPAAHDLDLFHTVARIKLRDDASIGFGDDIHDLKLDAHVDHLNFRELDAGTIFGHLRNKNQPAIYARGENDEDVTEKFLEVDANHLKLKMRVMPSMLTLDERIIRQDCLCYFMERLPAPS